MSLRWLYLALLIFVSADAQLLASDASSPVAWHDDRVDSVWQWSIAAPTIPQRRAFLWVPPTCKYVRGVVVGVQNMLEEPLFERVSFRNACSENDLAILMVFSGHDSMPGDDRDPTHPQRSSLDVFLNPTYPKGEENPKGAGEDLQKLLNTFAAISGYSELAQAPLMPVGHSSAGSFVWHLYRWNPDRIFAMLPLKTGLKNDGPSGIPIFNIESQWFDFGHETKDVSSTRSAIKNQRSIRERNENELFSFYVDIGSGHCNVSDDSIKLISLFLKKAVQSRIPTHTQPGQPVKLLSLDLARGWLIAPDKLGKPDVSPVEYQQWKGDPKQAFWYLDQELADAVQSHMEQQYAKRPQQINFVKADGSVPTAGGMFNFSPKFIDDLGTFRLEANYLHHLDNTDVYAADNKFENGGGPILYRVNSGAVRQIGADTFRIIPHAGPLGPQGNPWEPTLVAYTLGNDAFRPAERPAHANLPIVNKTGSPQMIDFPKLADHAVGDLSPIQINATASSGLTVQYFVVGGPVRLEADGKSFSVTEVPANARFPMTVEIGAFQWGRLNFPQIQTAPEVFQKIRITRDR